MSRIIKIKNLTRDGYVDAATVEFDDYGDISIDGNDKNTRQKIFELAQTGIDIDGVLYTAETFADGLLLFYNSDNYSQAREVQ